MRFGLDDDQKEIKQVAREMLRRHASPERVRERMESGVADESLRDVIAELGWTGIAIEEEDGGLGLGSVGAAVLLEECGYALASGPLLGTVCAAFAIDAAGSEQQREDWLSRLADGSCEGTLGVSRRGVADLVPEAEQAELIVLVEDGRAVLLERGAATVEPRATIDSTRDYARVSGEGELLPGDPTPALARSAVAVAAELVGVAQRALDETVSYVGEREQFGRPIGSFQAVAHRCAEMLVEVEGARSTAYFGAWSADTNQELAYAAALAKATASEAALFTTAAAVQAHGGVGFTWEADPHLFYKRAQLDAQLYGTASEYRRTMASSLRERLE